MNLYLYPTLIQHIAADQHGDVLPAARKWAGDARGFLIDRANDRLQLRRAGTGELDDALSTLRAWIQEMSDAGKRTYVINEWPDCFELRNRFETTLTNAGYSAKLGSEGRYIIQGANSMEIGQIVVTPDGWVAFRGSPLPRAKSVETSPQLSAQAAFDEFLRLDGFLQG